MIKAERFFNSLDAKGFGPYIGVPCSFLKPLINYAIKSESHEYIAANNEGEAVAIASGAYLAGKRPVVLLQNSGLGNCVNPLSSLNFVFKIPVLMIVSLRGEPGRQDEPQHELMGQITAEILKLLRVECQFFPTEDDLIDAHVNQAHDMMNANGLPVAFLMQKGSVQMVEAEVSQSPVFRKGNLIQNEEEPTIALERSEAIAVVSEAVGPNTPIVATTGKISRELFALHDRPSQFYVVGSMGCASSIGLGLAFCQHHNHTVVLDGDGAALMRMESWVSIGHYRPVKYIYVVLDNESYESTGGQDTLSPTVKFDEIAVAVGFSQAVTVYSKEKLKKALHSALGKYGPHLIHVKVKKGSDPNLGRPTLTPAKVKERFMCFVEESMNVM